MHHPQHHQRRAWVQHFGLRNRDTRAIIDVARRFGSWFTNMQSSAPMAILEWEGAGAYLPLAPSTPFHSLHALLNESLIALGRIRS